MSGRGGRLSPAVVGVVLAAAVLAWLARLPLLTPIIWFGTLVHESGHALAAEATGGDVVALTINEHGGGVTAHRGPPGAWRVVAISSAGYLSTVVAGALLLVAAGRVRDPLRVLLPVAGAVALATVLWVPWNSPSLDAVTAVSTGSDGNDGKFTWAFCVLTTAGLTTLAYLPARFGRVALLFLGAMCLLVGLDSLRELVGWSFDGGHSDAAIVSSQVGLPSWVWAGAWTVVGVGVGWWAVRQVLEDWDIDLGP